MSEPVMPFGRWKGTPVAKVPRGYLRWALNNLELRPWLREHVEAALGIISVDVPKSIEDQIAEMCEQTQRRSGGKETHLKDGS